MGMKGTPGIPQDFSGDGITAGMKTNVAGLP